MENQLIKYSLLLFLFMFSFIGWLFWVYVIVGAMFFSADGKILLNFNYYGEGIFEVILFTGVFIYVIISSIMLLREYRW